MIWWWTHFIGRRKLALGQKPHLTHSRNHFMEKVISNNLLAKHLSVLVLDNHSIMINLKQVININKMMISNLKETISIHYQINNNKINKKINKSLQIINVTLRMKMIQKKLMKLEKYDLILSLKLSSKHNLNLPFWILIILITYTYRPGKINIAANI